MADIQTKKLVKDLAEKDEHINQLTTELAEKDKLNDQLTSELAEREKEINELKEELTRLRQPGVQLVLCIVNVLTKGHINIRCSVYVYAMCIKHYVFFGKS